jgi:hypothetical protein
MTICAKLRGPGWNASLSHGERSAPGESCAGEVEAIRSFQIFVLST